MGENYPHRYLIWPALILALAIVATAFLPRYEYTEVGRLDRWTGEVCRQVPIDESGEDPWAKPGATRLVCTR